MLPSVFIGKSRYPPPPFAGRIARPRAWRYISCVWYAEGWRQRDVQDAALGRVETMRHQRSALKISLINPIGLGNSSCRDSMSHCSAVEDVVSRRPWRAFAATLLFCVPHAHDNSSSLVASSRPFRAHMRTTYKDIYLSYEHYIMTSSSSQMGSTPPSSVSDQPLFRHCSDCSRIGYKKALSPRNHHLHHRHGHPVEQRDSSIARRFRRRGAQSKGRHRRHQPSWHQILER